MSTSAALLLGGLAVPGVSAAAGTTATMRAPGTAVAARAGASTADRLRYRITNGRRLTVRCQVYGQLISGSVRRSAYWDRLSDGSYVSDAYVRWSPRRPAVPWCHSAGAATAAVHTGGRLAVRSGPRTSARRVGGVPAGRRVHVGCQAWGERVRGPVRTTPLWYRIGRGRYVSGGYVNWRPGVPVMPFCGQAPPTVPAGSAAAFLRRVAPAARAGDRRYRVPASVTIAQAILESGWGRSGLTRRDHNYFGIKCFGSPGPLGVGCRTYRTSECRGTDCYRTRAQFRAYRNASASFADHGRFLRTGPRYRPAFRYVNQPDNFVRAIHKAGYATSPTYARNLIQIMRQYNLYRYDR